MSPAAVSPALTNLFGCLWIARVFGYYEEEIIICSLSRATALSVPLPYPCHYLARFSAIFSTGVFPITETYAIRCRARPKIYRHCLLLPFRFHRDHIYYRQINDTRVLLAHSARVSAECARRCIKRDARLREMQELRRDNVRKARLLRCRVFLH